MADLMQQARELLAQQHRSSDQRRAKAIRIGHSSISDDDHKAIAATAAALRSTPGWAIDPTPEMLEAGRAAVMAEHCASPRWTPRQHYEASGRSMAGIPEDVLDERGPLTKESVAVMVFGTMVAHRPQEASDA